MLSSKKMLEEMRAMLSEEVREALREEMERRQVYPTIPPVYYPGVGFVPPPGGAFAGGISQGGWSGSAQGPGFPFGAGSQGSVQSGGMQSGSGGQGGSGQGGMQAGGGSGQGGLAMPGSPGGMGGSAGSPGGLGQATPAYSPQLLQAMAQAQMQMELSNELQTNLHRLKEVIEASQQTVKKIESLLGQDGKNQEGKK